MTTATISRDSDSLAVYHTEIGRHELITAEEEQELALRFRRTGDRQAAERLVTANLRFVVKIAAEYRGYRLGQADLIQEGNLGLLKAVEKFDPKRQTRLISYAVWWIRAYIQSYILRSWSLVKLGTTQSQRRLFFSLNRARREIERLDQSGNTPATAAALAKRLGVKTEEVIEMEQRMTGRDLSLEAPIDDQGTARLDLVRDDDIGPDDQVADAQVAAMLNKRVAASIAQLDARERYVITRRVIDDRPATFRDLGEQLHVSRERARQIEVRAKRKLKTLLESSLDGLDVLAA